MKTSRYNFVLYDEYYGYWYNSLSGFYFRLSLELSRKIESSLNCLDVLKREATPLYDKLTKYGFIIENNVDELAIVRERHQRAVHSKNYFLVILPTLNCNFKCWYCIQNHVPSYMKANTLEALKKHIDYMIEVKQISSLHIDWFGGEPFMLFKKIIVPLSMYAIEKCALHGIPFINSSTTNGYFITPKVSNCLTDLKFTNFQITLDGEKEFHDKVKFMDGCSSTFEHVLNNINDILNKNANIRIFLRINYTHKNLSQGIIPEVNKLIFKENRPRITITPKKVWQEDVDKSFGVVLQKILDYFEKSGYVVSRREIATTFIPCYVNKEYYNAINYNGNVVKCTACDDIHKETTKGRLLDDGRIVWEDSYDTKCQSPTFENEKCLRCNRLPVCMGLCPRDYMSGFSHCKYEVMDENFDVSLLDYLQHQLG